MKTKIKCRKCGGKNTTIAEDEKIKGLYLCHDCVIFFAEKERQESIDNGLLTAAGEKCI